MYDEKIKELKATIETLSLTIATKTAEVKAALEAEDIETAKALKADVESAKADLATANENLYLFEETLKTGGAENKGGREVPQEELTYRDGLNEFIRSKGKVVNEGLRFETKDEVLVPMNEIVPTTDGVKKADANPYQAKKLFTHHSVK